MRWRDAWLPLLVFAALAIAPFAGFGQGWVMTLLARAMIFGMAAISLSLLVGGAGLVSASRGNHSQSLAYAGAAFGVPVTIVVPVRRLRRPSVLRIGLMKVMFG